MKDRYILAFETSCDETSVAVLKNDDELLSKQKSQPQADSLFYGIKRETWFGI